MNTSIFVWAVLVIVGVSDAKSHRIPNKLLLLLLMLLCLSTLIHNPQQVLWPVFLDKSLAFAIAFAFSLALHLIKVMAPGDVKLLSVLGFLLGTGELVNYAYYVCLITAFVGCMYWLLNRLQVVVKVEASNGPKGQATHMSFVGTAVNMQLSQQTLKKKITTGNATSYMPFAPILVIGLALHQYYS